MHWLTIYSKSTLPVNGWIQNCFICDHPTAKTVEYTKKEYTHTVHLCQTCQTGVFKTHESKEMYKKRVDNYIRNHTPQPFEVPVIPLHPPKITTLAPPSTAEVLPRPHTIKKQNVDTDKASDTTVAVPEIPDKKRIPKSMYNSIFEMASKKISSYIQKVIDTPLLTHAPVDPNPPDPREPPPRSVSSVTNSTSTG
jgi:hypothetical protein